MRNRSPAGAASAAAAAPFLHPIPPGLAAVRSWVELVVASFAGVTLAYWLLALLRFPSGLLRWPVAAALAVAAGGVLWAARRVARGGERTFVAGLLALGAAVALFGSLVARPNADDVQLFFAPFRLLAAPQDPFPATELFYDVRGIPSSSIMLVISYGHALAAAAGLLGLPPIAVLHVLVPAAAALLLALVYGPLLRQLGLDSGEALAGFVLLVLFLVVDGNAHRSLGSVTLLRLWQGKTLLWTLLVPLAVEQTWRLLDRPSPHRWAALAGSGIAAAGLSATGLFLLPAAVLAASLAHWVVAGDHRRRLARLLAANLASVPAAAILAAMMVGVLPTLDLARAYGQWPNTWSGNLGLVIDRPATAFRDLLLCTAVVVAAPAGRLVVAYTVAVVALYLNPWTGGPLLALLTPGSYWRLAYLLPVPLGAALLVRCRPRPGVRRRAAALALASGLAAVAATAWAFERSPLAPPGVWRKAPGELRFHPQDLAFARRAAPAVRQRHLLAPERMVHVLPLLEPQLTLEATRRVQTRLDFLAIGRFEEGRRRVRAQAAVGTCRDDRGNREALGASLPQVDAVIVGPCRPAARERRVAELLAGGGWSERLRDERYVLLLREVTARSATGRREGRKPPPPP